MPYKVWVFHLSLFIHQKPNTISAISNIITHIAPTVAVMVVN